MKTLIVLLLCSLATAGCISLMRDGSDEKKRSHGGLQSPVFDFTHSLTTYIENTPA